MVVHRCVPCYWGMQLQIARRLVMVGSRRQWVAMVVPCYWGMQLQIARRLVLVGSRRQWVADGGAVFLGNAIEDC